MQCAVGLGGDEGAVLGPGRQKRDGRAREGSKERPPSALRTRPCSVVATMTSGSSGLTAKSAIGSSLRVSQVALSWLTMSSPVNEFSP
ncbi:hypothetical protein REH70_13430 [Cellulomonas sp. ATA003]|nr:hypothetical protein [Cellulomonas sp. ATA003]WNB84765.1 hypothetical protein REH70_13430 [Cellulomonas sp. ATA003]